MLCPQMNKVVIFCNKGDIAHVQPQIYCSPGGLSNIMLFTDERLGYDQLASETLKNPIFRRLRWERENNTDDGFAQLRFTIV